MKFEHTITDLPVENEYPKLIRDKIPQIIRDHDDREAATRRAKDDDELLVYLLRKVAEEAGELSHATDDSNMVEEIADVYEIIDELLELRGISRDDVLAVQQEKRAKRGGFKDRLIMLHNN